MWVDTSTVHSNNPWWRDMASSCVHDRLGDLHDSSQAILSRSDFKKPTPLSPLPLPIQVFPGSAKAKSIPPLVVGSGGSAMAFTNPRAAVPSRGSSSPATMAPDQPPTPERTATYSLPYAP